MLGVGSDGACNSQLCPSEDLKRLYCYMEPSYISIDKKSHRSNVEVHCGINLIHSIY